MQPVAVLTASPRFFQAIGIPLVAGRELIISDTNAAVASESLAQLFWQRMNPLGQPLKLPDGTTLTVVGIAKDIDPLRLGGTENPPLHRSLAANAPVNTIAIHFDSRLQLPTRLVRAAIRQIEPNQPVQIRTMQR